MDQTGWYWGQRGYYPGDKLRIFEDLFLTLLSINPVSKAWVYLKKTHHFDLNKPSEQIESLITKNPSIYLWATVWKNPWVSFINLIKICPQYTWATCYVQIPDVTGNGRSRGRERVWLIAIDYHTVAGTAGAECKGDWRLKKARRSESRTDSNSLTETQGWGDLEMEREGQIKQG